MSNIIIEGRNFSDLNHEVHVSTNTQQQHDRRLNETQDVTLDFSGAVSYDKIPYFAKFPDMHSLSFDFSNM